MLQMWNISMFSSQTDTKSRITLLSGQMDGHSSSAGRYGHYIRQILSHHISRKGPIFIKATNFSVCFVGIIAVRSLYDPLRVVKAVVKIDIN